MREHYARLVALRHGHAVLRSERLEVLQTSHPESVLAYVRPGERREEDIIVLLNYHPKAARVTLPISASNGARFLLDLMSGPAIPLASEAPAVDLPEWGARVLCRSTEDTVR